MINADTLKEKWPRIEIMKLSNGFLVGIFPENKDIQKIMQNYIKDIINSIQNQDGDEWKSKIEADIQKALNGGDDIDKVKLFICKDEFEVMGIVAPKSDNEALKAGKPDLSWFWSEQGHVPGM